jgi:hypothetical protein
MSTPREGRAAPSSLPDAEPPIGGAVERAPHWPGCKWVRAVTCAVPIPCEHGFDACPQCDPCDCTTPFQARVWPWMTECFGPVIPLDKVERGDRLLEEVFELLQSGGYDPARVLELRDYTWGRPPGEPRQEAGGVMVTLAAYCLAHGIDMHDAGEAELARIWTKVEAIRAKQQAKPRGIALPIAPAEHAMRSAPDPGKRFVDDSALPQTPAEER